jgi:hypothetical protein
MVGVTCQWSNAHRSSSSFIINWLSDLHKSLERVKFVFIWIHETWQITCTLSKWHMRTHLQNRRCFVNGQCDLTTQGILNPILWDIRVLSRVPPWPEDCWAVGWWEAGVGELAPPPLTWKPGRHLQRQRPLCYPGWKSAIGVRVNLWGQLGTFTALKYCRGSRPASLTASSTAVCLHDSSHHPETLSFVLSPL